MGASPWGVACSECRLRALASSVVKQGQQVDRERGQQEAPPEYPPPSHPTSTHSLGSKLVSTRNFIFPISLSFQYSLARPALQEWKFNKINIC